MIECQEHPIRRSGISLPSPTLTKRDADAFPTSPFAHLPYLHYSTYLILHTYYSPVFSLSHLPHPSTNTIQPFPFPSSPQSKTMLPRPATKLHLTIDDITDYERRKAQRDALQQAQQKQQQQAQQTQTQEKKFVEEEEEKEESTRARAKAKVTREHQQRIMGSRT